MPGFPAFLPRTGASGGPGAAPAVCHDSAMNGVTRPRYLCDRCGRELPPGLPARPCTCGGTGRRRVDPADAFGRPPTADAPRWDPLKDWAAKYLQLTWNVGQLRRLSAAGSEASAEEIRRIIETTFAAARDLADWLAAGPEPASVSPGDVDRLAAESPLAVGTALVRGSAAGTARLVPVGFARPPRFWVEYQRPNAKPVRYEALDLAERCLVRWQTFLSSRGVRLPSW
jgi:hypothetical protein